MNAIGKDYASTVLDGVSLTLRCGEVLALTGENGAGKSTLAKILCGLMPATRGEMQINGKPFKVAFFAPASGRQLPSLQRTLGPLAERIDGYIAENGGLVVHHGVDITSSVLPSETVAAVVHGVRQLVASGRFDLGLIVSCHDWAYAERKDPRFLDAAGRFYTNLRSVADLRTHTHDALKLSIYDFGDSHASADSVAALCPDAQVVVASEDWVDVMNVGVNKGVALAQLQAALGVTPAQTVAFGDYLNDLEMLAQAEHSFAMANAHPEAIDTAAYVAPSNLALGVVATLNHLLDQLPSAN